MKRLMSVLLVLVLSNCGKDQNIIPEYIFDISIRLDLPQYQDLAIIGGWSYVLSTSAQQAGYRGLIVYRYNLDEFKVFDRACTYSPLETCHVLDVDDTALAIKCPCDSSIFNFDGFVLRGPASINLKEYQTVYYRANNTLRIYNNF